MIAPNNLPAQPAAEGDVKLPEVQPIPSQGTKEQPPSAYQLEDLRLKRFTLCVQIAGIVLVVAGLILNWSAITNSTKATENSTRATDNATLASLSAWTFDIDKLFVQKPELRPYFYDGKDVKVGDVDYGAALSMAELHADVMDSMLDTKGFPPHEGWGKWLRNSFDTSPVLLHWVTEKHEYYPKLWEKVQRWQAENEAKKQGEQKANR